MKKNNIYSYEVLPREVDFKLNATLCTMGENVLHTAGLDADRLGFSVDTLQQKNMTWVLLRWAIEMERYPKQHEKYTIETWIEDVNRLMSTRNFIIRDEAGEQIGASSTNWTMIDFKTRYPLDLRNIDGYLESIHPVPTPIAKPERIGAITGGIVETRKIQYSDIDFNRHTSSIKYMEWMVDAVPLEELLAKTIRRFDINYVHETTYGQEVSLLVEEKGDGFGFEIRDENQCAARGLLRWGE